MAQTAEGNALTPEQRMRMCTSKRGFAKEGQALDFAVRCQQRTGKGWVYRCPVCRKYHVGTRGRLLAQPEARG
jgi:hypothetical protein